MKLSELTTGQDRSGHRSATDPFSRRPVPGSYRGGSVLPSLTSVWTGQGGQGPGGLAYPFLAFFFLASGVGDGEGERFLFL